MLMTRQIAFAARWKARRRMSPGTRAARRERAGAREGNGSVAEERAACPTRKLFMYAKAVVYAACAVLNRHSTASHGIETPSTVRSMRPSSINAFTSVWTLL